MKTIINLISFVLSLAMLGGFSLLLYKCYTHSKLGLDALLPELRPTLPKRAEGMSKKAHTRQTLKAICLWVLVCLFYVLPSIFLCLLFKALAKGGEKASDAIAYGIDKLDEKNGLTADTSTTGTTPKGE